MRSLALLLFATAAAAKPIDLAKARVVDLTHPLDEKTLYWPASPPSGFQLRRLHHGKTPAGFFYAANAFCTPEHGGTHLDAPIHFAEGKQSVDEIPVRRMVAPAVVIDVSAAAAKDADHRLTLDEVRAFEKASGRIPDGAIVLLRTGWGARWPDRKGYLGDDSLTDATRLHFPSYGREAAGWLVKERKVTALGVDTASIDHGPSRDFVVHQIAGAANVAGLENLAALDQLPPTGAWVVALPIKIAGGSGGPMRIVALLPDEAGPEEGFELEDCVRPTPGKRFRLDLRGDVEVQVLADALAAMLCRPVVVSTSVLAGSGTVRVFAPGLLSPGELLDLFRDALASIDLTVTSQKGGALVARPGPKWKPGRASPGASPLPEPAASETADLFDAEVERGVRCQAGACDLDRAVLDKLLASTTVLATTARFVPAIRDGNTVGFKLYAIRARSLWDRLGLRNGDLIRSINGIEMTTPDRALEIYTRFRTASRIVVGLERAGAPLTIEITVR